MEVIADAVRPRLTGTAAWLLRGEHMAIVLDDPFQPALPSPFPGSENLHPFSLIHAGMFQTPFDKLSPAIDHHVCLTYHGLVEVMG